MNKYRRIQGAQKCIIESSYKEISKNNSNNSHSCVK